MAEFLILHSGFEKPTPEEMGKWHRWFDLINDRLVEKGGLPVGVEFSKVGRKELPFTHNSVTGYTIIKAENLEEAANIAGECPFVLSTRVYEIRR